MASAVACISRTPNLSEKQALLFAAEDICSRNPDAVLPELTADLQHGKWFITWSSESGTGLFSVGTSSTGKHFLAQEGGLLKIAAQLSPQCSLAGAAPIAKTVIRSLNLTPPSATTITESDLRRALLSVDDLPAGWEVQETLESPIKPSDLCGISQSVQAGRQAAVVAVFRAGDLGPYLAHAVMTFPEDEATQAMAGLESAISSCTGWVYDEGLITESLWTVSLQNAPALGDQAIAAQAIGVATGPVDQRYTDDTIYIRRGHLISSLIYLTDADQVRDTSQLSSLAVLVDARLAQLLE